MGLPTKYAFCGVPGRRGYNTSLLGDVKFISPELHPHSGKEGIQYSPSYGNGKYQNSIPVYTSFEMPRM